MSPAAWRKFICRACGLVYDEALGDEDSGLAAGTRFEDIPDDWACPLCGVTKADFEPYDPLPVPQRAAPVRRLADGKAPARGNGFPPGSPPRVSTGRLAAGRGMGGVVVVGGGTAAWALVECLRALDPDRPITMVAACTADRYDKPRLSVAFRQGVTPEALPLETGRVAAARLGIRLMAQTHAVGVDMNKRRLRTTRGTVEFDELVLAHGAQARRCPGLPDELTWRINDLDSYARLRQALAARSAVDSCNSETGAQTAPVLAASVILVGAGLVGCELANDLALAGHPVTLIESSDRPLPMATPDQSRELLAAWSGLPLRFIGQQQIRAAHRDAVDGRIHVELQSGSTLRADVLISAVGLATPSRLAEQAGLQWDNGIAVDGPTLGTGVDRVHALGDCISIDGRPQRFIEPIRRQAATVAARICGHTPPHYDARPVPIRVKTSSRPLTLAA